MQANTLSGWETSAVLHDQMVKYIVREMLAVAPDSSVHEVASKETDEALREAFTSLDRDIMDAGIRAIYTGTDYADGMAQTRPSQAGSCALVSYYNSVSQILKVACTGDSRAVLGERDAAGIYTATPLSADQTGFNEDEVARLRDAHPNEPNMIGEEGRLLRLAVTRAFGDSFGKWSRHLQDLAVKRFNGSPYPTHSLTPPYITAEPVITTKKIDLEKWSFLIMASDGLWDRMTNDQAVDLIKRWLEFHDPSQEVAPADTSLSPTSITPQPAENEAASRPQRHYASFYTADEANFVVKDDNAATHLVRNALGGKDEDMLRGLLTASPPKSRQMRDDISVQVIFFGQDVSSFENN